MSFVSLYGTDGCGKSTIARELASQIPSAETTIIMGGSSYKEWLTPDLAHDFMGDKHSFGEPAQSPEEKVRLYEDIAVVCYGLAHRLQDEGKTVIIDSDPYLKRVIWGTLDPLTPQPELYAERFSERMADYLDDSIAPRALIGINVSPTTTTGHEDLLARISVRGDNNSEYDPTDSAAMFLLDNQVRSLWQDIDTRRTDSGVYRRMRATQTTEYENPQCDSQLLGQQLGILVASVIERHY